MKNPITDLEKFRKFLESIPLNNYRQEFKDIKWVEQDLPKEILPLTSIFSYYWEERNYLCFDEWFEKFWKEINANPESKQSLSEFKKYFFDKEIEEDGWFKKGFKARMYRTWISVLTQLDFCYLFEYICARENNKLLLECSAELDIKGIDAKVGEIEFQVAKISQRKEARTSGGKKKVITIPYAVFNIEEFKRKSESFRVKDKEGYKRALYSFSKYFKVLNNGFVVFKEDYLRPIIDNIGSIEKVREIVSRISQELSGET
ncbi:MAG: TaqI family restriction endonuclease [Candidatus Omnitrophica bacterium]|nr:TaqI family restriction endonuclease [Candidatus Omnitrophota bacterium]